MSACRRWLRSRGGRCRRERRSDRSQRWRRDLDDGHGYCRRRLWEWGRSRDRAVLVGTFEKIPEDEGRVLRPRTR